MTTIDINVPADVRLGHLAIPGKPLLRVGALMVASEAMAQLRLDEPPPPLWQVEMDDVIALLSDLPGVAETADRHPLAMSVYRMDEEPIVLIQEGLPSLAQRVIIRHELAHLAQARAGRMEVVDAGPLGRWHVLPAGSVALLQSGQLPPLEVEANAFQNDARYVAERAALELTAPPGKRYMLGRGEDGKYGWQLGPRIHATGGRLS